MIQRALKLTVGAVAGLSALFTIIGAVIAWKMNKDREAFQP